MFQRPRDLFCEHSELSSCHIQLSQKLFCARGQSEALLVCKGMRWHIRLIIKTLAESMTGLTTLARNHKIHQR